MAERKTLVIIPCGKAKIWDRAPQLGAVAAREAYTGGPFRVNRTFAEVVAARWLILSARYGFIEPDFPLPGPYNTSFTRPSDPHLVTDETLRRQAQQLGLDSYPLVVGLGGKEYRQHVAAAFAGAPARLVFPFANCGGVGQQMAAIKQALDQEGGRNFCDQL